jgi:S-formylglutathione hydrolase
MKSTALSLVLLHVVSAGAAPLTRPPRGEGTIERIRVHGESLAGNLQGESSDRDVSVYLPPNYAGEQKQRYPVLYLLHGYGASDATWTGDTVRVRTIVDAAVTRGASPKVIVVMPNASSRYLGSMYSNSVTAGNWEGYVADDLVQYVDRHYRTVADRRARGLAGHSMGGYGALRIGMKRPDVFGAVYAMSACCLTASLNPFAQSMAAAEQIGRRADVKDADSTTLAIFARAAAWSPNPGKTPLFFDLPAEDGTLRPEIVAKWAANAPLAMLDQYVSNLKRLNGLAFDVGEQDEAVSPAAVRTLHERLAERGIEHQYETFEGGHANRMADRLGFHVLPFFARTLTIEGAQRGPRHAAQPGSH